MVDAISRGSFDSDEELKIDELVERGSNIQESPPLTEAEIKRKHELVQDLLRLGNELVEQVEKDDDEQAIQGNVQKLLTMLQFIYERFASQISKEDKKRVKELKKQANDASKEQGKETLKKSTIALVQGLATLALVLASGAALDNGQSSTSTTLQKFADLAPVVGSFPNNRYDAAIGELANKVRLLQTELDNKSQKSMQDGGKQQVQQAVDAKRQAERQALRFA